MYVCRTWLWIANLANSPSPCWEKSGLLWGQRVCLHGPLGRKASMVFTIICWYFQMTGYKTDNVTVPYIGVMPMTLLLPTPLHLLFKLGLFQLETKGNVWSPDLPLWEVWHPAILVFPSRGCWSNEHPRQPWGKGEGPKEDPWNLNGKCEGNSR